MNQGSVSGFKAGSRPKNFVERFTLISEREVRQGLLQVEIHWLQTQIPLQLSTLGFAETSLDGFVSQQRECELRGLPLPQVLPLDGDDVKYKVNRGRRPAPPGPRTWHRLIFPRAVSDPICLGASAHFGVGRFVPER